MRINQKDIKKLCELHVTKGLAHVYKVDDLSTFAYFASEQEDPEEFVKNYDVALRVIEKAKDIPQAVYLQQVLEFVKDGDDQAYKSYDELFYNNEQFVHVLNEHMKHDVEPSRFRKFMTKVKNFFGVVDTENTPGPIKESQEFQDNLFFLHMQNRVMLENLKATFKLFKTKHLDSVELLNRKLVKLEVQQAMFKLEQERSKQSKRRINTELDSITSQKSVLNKQKAAKQEEREQHGSR